MHPDAVTARGGRLLLERDDELAALSGAYAESRTGRGRLVLIAGEAGAGKTSLIEAFCARNDAGGRAAWGRCDAIAVPRPLAAFAEIVEAQPGRPAEPDGGAEGLFAVLDRVRALVASGTRVLVLEDLHWADEASLGVLRLLGRRIESVPALVLATYRDDQLERSHPLRLTLGDLASTAGVSRLSLERLSPEAVATLSEGSELDPNDLYRLTSGNPFYVAEAIDAGGDGVPPTVREAVLSRVARVGPDALSVLEAAAIAPPALEPRLLERLCGEAVAAVEACFDAGLLADIDGGVGFRHELARVAVHDRIVPTRRRALHAEILAALTALPNPDSARLAFHAEGAADAAAVLRWAPAAAADAGRLGAYREAAAQYARALRSSAGSTPLERAALLEARAEALFNTDQQVESIEVLRGAVAERRAAGDVSGAAAAMSSMVRHLMCRCRLSDARTTTEEALQLLESEPDPDAAAVAAVEGTMALLHLNESDPDAAIAWSTRAIEHAERAGAAAAALNAEITRASARLSRDGESAAAGLADLVPRAAALDGGAQLPRVLNNLAQLSILHHRYAPAEAAIREGLEYCEGADLDLWRLCFLDSQARMQLDRCEWDAAAATVRQLTTDDYDSPDVGRDGHAMLALLRARRGDPGAADALADAAALADGQDAAGATAALAVVRAELAWLSGDVDAIGPATAEALAWCLDRRLPWQAGELACWRRRAGLEVPVDGALSAPAVLELEGRFTEAADAWRDLGCRYESAMARAASGDDEEVRRAHAELVELGALGAAAALARYGRANGVRGLRHGPRSRTRENPAGLTAREVEVLELLAEGLSNAEIADRLVLSQRTVEHHVSAVLRKLDVSSRTRAGVEAVRLGVVAPV